MPLGPPSLSTRLKRRLIRDLVRENLELIHGLPPRARRRRWPLQDALRLLAVLLLPVALYGSSQLLAGGASTSPSAWPPEVHAAVPFSPPAAALAARTAAAHLPAPTPIDPAVFPLAVRRVAIDPGHGGASLGTRAPEGPVEKALTLDIARRLERLLAAEGFEPVLTRRGDREVPLRERALLANRAGADLFVSIHLNWIEDRGARGVETYYAGTSSDPAVNELAAAENRDSGYSMADLKPLLERIYTDVRQEESRRFAAQLQGALVRSLAAANPALQDRGVKAAPFIVLITTEMPSVLAEVSCLSNSEEARLLARPEYRQAIAEALSTGVRSYAAGVATASVQKGI
ncbi:MAG TPA: N-acetylmuramoyl-L-alanine amidase [Thermoanaerobaculia bacterium]|nr:N-acetylmuramoyl-L-alanine amidase [Thermoanaerobaculia bacterium]